MISLTSHKGFRGASVRKIAVTVTLMAAAGFGAPTISAQTTTPASASTRSRSSTKAHAAAQDSAVSATPVKTFGNKNAPITMEVFSDYQCPSCRNFFEETLKPLLGPDGYVAAGKVYLVHRDFPLPMHQYSHQAARWANAAAKIGKFQDVDAALFDNQSSWAADGDIEKYVAAAMSPADFKRVERLMAGCDGGTNAPGIKPAALKSGAGEQGCALDAYINADMELGKAVPVQATPTFVIFYKGQKYPASSGIVTYPILKQFFDSLLSQ